MRGSVVCINEFSVPNTRDGVDILRTESHRILLW